MAGKRFAKNISIILGIGGVLVLFSFVLVAHHRDIPDRVRQNRNVLLGAGSSASVKLNVYYGVGYFDRSFADLRE